MKDQINPICLPVTGQTFPTGMSCWTTGFGATTEGGMYMLFLCVCMCMYLWMPYNAGLIPTVATVCLQAEVPLI